MKLFGIIAPLVMSLTMTACMTETKSESKQTSATPQTAQKDSELKNVMPVAAERSTEGDGGLLMVADFQGRESAKITDTTCRWRMVNKDTSKSYFVTFSPEQKNSFTSLPAGHYATGRLGCGIGKIWDLDKIYASGFHIEGGQTSYLGKLIFIFKGRQLSEVKKASRAESTQALVTAVQALPQGSTSLVSAFTERTIASPMYKVGDVSEGFDIQGDGVQNAVTVLNPLAKTLKACANTEIVNDPIRIGRLEYSAAYKNGRFTEMKTRNDNNAFSDRMRSCVEQSLMRFQASDKSDFLVRVKY